MAATTTVAIPAPIAMFNLCCFRLRSLRTWAVTPPRLGVAEEPALAALAAAGLAGSPPGLDLPVDFDFFFAMGYESTRLEPLEAWRWTPDAGFSSRGG